MIFGRQWKLLRTTIIDHNLSYPTTDMTVVEQGHGISITQPLLKSRVLHMIALFNYYSYMYLCGVIPLTPF